MTPQLTYGLSSAVCNPEEVALQTLVEVAREIAREARSCGGNMPRRQPQHATLYQLSHLYDMYTPPRLGEWARGIEWQTTGAQYYSN